MLFRSCFGIRKIRFGIDIEALLMAVVTFGLDFFKRRFNFRMHFIQESVSYTHLDVYKRQLMSLAHFMCAVGTGRFCSFETGYHDICDTIQLAKYRYLFQCAKASNDFDSFMKFAV